MRGTLLQTINRLAYLLGASVVLFSVLMTTTSALKLENVSVTTSSSAPNATTTQIFGFDYTSTSSVGSLRLLYCVNSPLFEAPCTPPVGFDITGASLDAQTGEVGFTVGSTPGGNEIILTRTSAPSLAVPATYTLSNVTNPSAQNQTVYVRIGTYATEDATGPVTDKAAAAFSTAQSLTVEAYVPPYLAFCVGITVGGNCSFTSGDFINLGQLGSGSTKSATSQFAVSTNDPAGYVVSIHGTTMTSGNNIIPANNPPAPSIKGKSQFGINLRSNSNPAVGQEAGGVGTGVPKPLYGIPNQFYFVPNSLVASSPLPTDYTVFTASYVVNVSQSQPTGVYSTTSSYVATAAF